MKTQFNEFPLCFKLSQAGIGGAASLSLLSSRLFQPVVPLGVQFFVAVALIGLVVGGLISSAVTLWKYPYLSLIEIENDYFSRYFNPNNPMVYRIIGFFAIVVLVINLAINWNKLDFSNHTGFVIVYLASLVPFLIFLVFIYTNDSYPTIATYLRATVGVGLLLFPLYLPLLVVASIRCSRLLDEADSKRNTGDD